MRKKKQYDFIELSETALKDLMLRVDTGILEKDDAKIICSLLSKERLKILYSLLPPGVGLKKYLLF